MERDNKKTLNATNLFIYALLQDGKITANRLNINILSVGLGDDHKNGWCYAIALLEGLIAKSRSNWKAGIGLPNK